MKVDGRIRIRYKNPEDAEVAYRSLEVDNKGFVDSEIDKEELSFHINSDSLGSFLATADDLIASEILVEKILEETKRKGNNIEKSYNFQSLR